VASAYGNTAAWCEGADRLTIKSGHFYLNGKRLKDNTVTDQTEETIIAFEYNWRLFVPCDRK
jgi:hypothetical protein